MPITATKGKNMKYQYLKDWEEPFFDMSRPIAFDTETAIPKGEKSKKKKLVT